LGLRKGQSNLYNEIEWIKSYVLIESVVKDLGLNVAFIKKRGYWDADIIYYGDNAPFVFEYVGDIEKLYNSSATFEFKVLNEKEFEIKEIQGGDQEVALGRYKFGKSFKCKLGNIKIHLNKKYSNALRLNTFGLNVSRLSNSVRYYSSALNVDPVNSNSSALELMIRGGHIERNEDFLSSLINQHEQQTIEDKNAITYYTSEFIAERMDIIEKELSELELSGQYFKSDNNIVSVEEDASNYLVKEGEVESQIIAVTIEKNMADFLVEYIKKYDDLTLLLPANVGFEESSVNSLSSDYNQLVIERNKIIQGSNENNPIAKRLEAQLLSIRESLDNTLSNVQNRLKIQIDELIKREKEYSRKIKSVPELERRYREIARQQQIKETLYLYLLQKREENQLAMASSMGAIKVLNPPSTSWKPISPNRSSTFFRAFLFGLAIPIGVIYLLGILDNKVRRREDLEGIGIPLVGEIPENKSGESLVVQKGERSMVAEAFRMLRANISFLIPDREKKGNVIYVSSTIAGEGKTFNAINLASSFALTGKKVVLIGMDLRAPKLSQYLEITDQAGVSNFVIDNSISVGDITISSKEVPNLSFILSGIIPPNPSELLLSPRITTLFSELKKEYDYIIVDNAPTALVADVANISEFADVFLYVVRANYLNKRDLQVPVKLKEEMEVKKLAFILNSTKYGLNGYNGYGYGYGDKGVYGEESKSWWSKLKRKN